LIGGYRLCRADKGLPRQPPRRATDPTPWKNNFGTLRCCAERRGSPAEFFVALAGITIRCLM
jgi:hypothetical protein